MSGRALSTGIAVFAVLLASRGMAVEPDVRPNDGFAGLSLRVSDEAAPAGSIVQIKIDVTEPKPISTGKGTVKVKGLANVQGIALMNHDQDTFGVALVHGDEISFAINSPSRLFGTPADYPIVAIAGTVANAAVGTTFPLTLDPGALRFVTPDGADYPLEIKDGQLTVANGVSIGNVSPGSSTVPAGGVVHISGTNFVPDTRLQLSETNVAETRYISSSRIDVVLAQAADMHGLRIRARNPDKSEATYFSYERTTSVTPSNDSVLSHAVPLFAPATFTTATVPLPRASVTKRRAVGHSGAGSSAVAGQQGRLALAFALQNLSASDVSASVELLDSFGNPYAVNTVTIGPGRYLVREIGEVFGTVSPPSAFRIKSAVPLQVLGIVAEHSGGTAIAVPPGNP
jgi:IPT/TIG domain-containing protein